MLHTRSTNAQSVKKVARRRGGHLRDRVAGARLSTGLVRTDFMGLSPLR